MGVIKNNTDLKSLRQAGQVAAWVCDELMKEARPGMTTMAMDELANRLLAEKRSSAPFKRFDGFGYAICVSLNDEIVNGPPSTERILKAGDVISVAIGSECRGMHGKAARTWYLGETQGQDAPEQVQRLIAGTQQVVDDLEQKELESLSQISEVVVRVSETHGLSVIKDSFGTGIGKNLHEAPVIPNSPDEATDLMAVEPGLAFVVMSMMSLGATGEWVELEDGWTQQTKDASLSAHVADTFLVTDHGLEVLTRV